MQRTRHELVAAWLEKARQDLVVARNALLMPEIFPGIICFHAQQAAEKALKAYLVGLGVIPPKTHQLEDLVALAAGYDAEIVTLSDPAASLTPYAVEARYPEAEQVTEEDARHAIEDAEEIHRYVLLRLGQAGWS
ncbi:MAG TPA: HEPN domain-containing protein [Methanoregulaceae archaeon]|nr:HEPN domain-containing protein [Methanoregulaceae archaeon]